MGSVEFYRNYVLKFYRNLIEFDRMCSIGVLKSIFSRDGGAKEPDGGGPTGCPA